MLTGRSANALKANEVALRTLVWRDGDSKNTTCFATCHEQNTMPLPKSKLGRVKVACAAIISTVSQWMAAAYEQEQRSGQKRARPPGGQGPTIFPRCSK